MLPGIVFESARERNLPGLEQSSFREGSRIALSSVVLTGVSIAVLASVRAVAPGLMPSAGQWLGAPHSYVTAHYRLIARTLVLEVGLASCMALIAARGLLPRQWRCSQSRPHSTISVVLHETATEPSSVPFVQLRTVQGTLFTGIVASHDASGPRNDRQIALRPPLSVHRPGADTASSLRWPRLVLPVADIAEMHVTYVREEGEPHRKPSSIRRAFAWVAGLRRSAASVARQRDGTVVPPV